MSPREQAQQIVKTWRARCEADALPDWTPDEIDLENLALDFAAALAASAAKVSAWICGQSATTMGLGFSPERLNGCGTSVSSADMIRCRNCLVPFHPECFDRHIGESGKEGYVKQETHNFAVRSAAQLMAKLQAREQALERVGVALQRLYDETADYIRINNLGDVHHNMSMQMARDALKFASPEARATGETT